MKFVDEYRDASDRPAPAGRDPQDGHVRLDDHGGLRRPDAHASSRTGIDELLPPQITLVHGPGCPVCVTPLELIDKALAHRRASRGASSCSFGDMLRVPGSADATCSGRSAAGGDVRIVYSPLDAVALARRNPEKAGRLLRRRLRDHGAGQRDGGLQRAREPASTNFSRARVARPRAAGDGGDPRRRRTTACRGSWRPGTSAP